MSKFRVAILTGREKGRAREAVLMGLADGSIDILVGTHAIFQQSVSYKRLGLAVVGGRTRLGRIASGVLLAAGSLLTRFGRPAVLRATALVAAVGSFLDAFTALGDDAT